MWEFLKRFGLRVNPFGNESHLPCYINRATVTDEFNKVLLIREYIEECKEYKAETISTLLFSVTQRDKYYKKWLKVAEEAGYVVVEGASIHGNYKCWSIIVQNDKFQGMAYYR